MGCAASSPPGADHGVGPSSAHLTSVLQLAMSMALREKTRDQRRPLAPADLRVNRGIGIFVLLVGAAFVYSLVFSSFDVRVRYQWEVTPDGGRTPVTHVTCPSPWSVTVDHAEPDVITTEGLCVMPSRTLWLEGAITSVVAILIATWFFTRTTRPGPLQALPVTRDTQRREVSP